MLCQWYRCWTGAQCRRNVVSGSEASATDRIQAELGFTAESLARQGRSSLTLWCRQRHRRVHPNAKAKTVPGRRRDCRALFWRRRACATNCGRQVVLTCSIQFQFLHLVGWIDNHGWRPCCWPCCGIFWGFMMKSLRVAMMGWCSSFPSLEARATVVVRSRCDNTWH